MLRQELGSGVGSDGTVGRWCWAGRWRGGHLVELELQVLLDVLLGVGEHLYMYMYMCKYKYEYKYQVLPDALLGVGEALRERYVSMYKYR